MSLKHEEVRKEVRRFALEVYEKDVLFDELDEFDLENWKSSGEPLLLKLEKEVDDAIVFIDKAFGYTILVEGDENGEIVVSSAPFTSVTVGRKYLVVDEYFCVSTTLARIVI